MDFYQADAYLEKAALHVTAYSAAGGEDDRRAATASLEQARALIDTMGYARRDRQVRELEAILARVSAEPARGEKGEALAAAPAPPG